MPSERVIQGLPIGDYWIPVLNYALDSSGVAVSTEGRTATPSIEAVTSSGSVAAGAKALWFELSSDFTGSILGKSYSGSDTTTVNIPIPAGHVCAAVSYTRTAGTLYIFKSV